MVKLKVLRIKAVLDIKTAAYLLNVKPDTLYKIESGQRRPSTYLKIKMACLYNCDINDI